MNSTSSSAAAAIGVGLVSVGWMGKLHTQGRRAKKFLVAVTGGERRNATVEDAHAVAEVIARPMPPPPAGPGRRSRRSPVPPSAGRCPRRARPTAEGHRHCPNVLDWIE
jgi:hypothetical protein